MHLWLTAYDNRQEIPDGSRDSLSRAFTRQVFEGEQDDFATRPVVSRRELSSYQITDLHQRIAALPGLRHERVESWARASCACCWACSRTAARNSTTPPTPASPASICA